MNTKEKHIGGGYSSLILSCLIWLISYAIILKGNLLFN